MLKELSSFLGVVEMVATANKHATKTITWTSEGFERSLRP